MKLSKLKNIIKKTILNENLKEAHDSIKDILKEQGAGPRPSMDKGMKMGGTPNISKIKASGFTARDYSKIYNSNPKLKSQGCPATIDPSILNEQVMPGKGERPPSNPGMQKHPLVWICIGAGFLLWGGPEPDDGAGGDEEIWPQ